MTRDLLAPASVTGGQAGLHLHEALGRPLLPQSRGFPFSPAPRDPGECPSNVTFHSVRQKPRGVGLCQKDSVSHRLRSSGRGLKTALETFKERVQALCWLGTRLSHKTWFTILLFFGLFLPRSSV